MIHVERYQPTDYPQLMRWLEARSSAYTPLPEELPELGCMVYDSGFAVASCFLRRVEGGAAQLDGLTTNPDASSASRHACIDAAVSHLIKIAKDLKIKGIIAHTGDLGVVTRALSRHGFTQVPQVVLALPLEQDIS